MIFILSFISTHTSIHENPESKNFKTITFLVEISNNRPKDIRGVTVYKNLELY